MKLTTKHRAYWRSTLWLTLSLLSVWFIVIFGSGYFADELNGYSFLGFPMGFYVFAQGSLIINLVIIGIYVLVMDRLDRIYGVAERR